jgi:hypothetical protein
MFHLQDTDHEVLESLHALTLCANPLCLLANTKCGVSIHLKKKDFGMMLTSCVSAALAMSIVLFRCVTSRPSIYG